MKIIMDKENAELTFKKYCKIEKKIISVTVTLKQFSDCETDKIHKVLKNYTKEEIEFVRSGITPAQQDNEY